ncbi:FecR family protein [Chitinophaga niastensis]|uniref:FecR family protein n=2 Tax=Chitinophaga niastensis TaxID=536980 RepID=A0A2P8HNS6_CHINA|nr:FecR family protein [Chitinophaga niastensis]
METLKEKIFELYIERLSGNLSAEEEGYVQQMLEQDAAFKAQWLSLEQDAKTLHVKDYLDSINSETALNTIKEGRERNARNRVVMMKKALAAAAVLLIITTGSYVFFFRTATPATKFTAAALQKNKQPVRLLLSHGETVELNKDSSAKTINLHNATLTASNGALQYTSADTMQNTLEVPAGENYKLTLSDGTEVWLNAATQLRFPFHFGVAAREVYVEGEAYFKVAKDAQHPFTVHTTLTSVQVLGTSFNINTYHTGTVQTALVEGSVVTMGKHGEKEALRPGYKADYEAAQGFTTNHFDEEDVLSWRNGVYYYHKMSLTALIEEASRFYGVRFVLDKDKFAGRFVTGLMDRNRLNDFLSDLKTTAHIEYQLSGHEITLK